MTNAMSRPCKRKRGVFLPPPPFPLWLLTNTGQGHIRTTAWKAAACESRSFIVDGPKLGAVEGSPSTNCRQGSGVAQRWRTQNSLGWVQSPAFLFEDASDVEGEGHSQGRSLYLACEKEKKRSQSSPLHVQLKVSQVADEVQALGSPCQPELARQK